MFVPREVLVSFEVGERIGDLLVRQLVVTQEQVDAAADEQRELRDRRVGDILVAQHIVSAERLMQAIEQQAKMPMVRIGEALLALDLITQAQTGRGARAAEQDRSVPLGEAAGAQGHRHALAAAIGAGPQDGLSAGRRGQLRDRAGLGAHSSPSPSPSGWRCCRWCCATGA